MAVVFNDEKQAYEGSLSAAAAQADHLVVTGDITNLALEHEYEEARCARPAPSRRSAHSM